MATAIAAGSESSANRINKWWLVTRNTPRDIDLTNLKGLASTKQIEYVCVYQEKKSREHYHALIKVFLFIFTYLSSKLTKIVF